MSNRDKLKKTLGGREWAALAGWTFGVLSTLGYTALYQRAQYGWMEALFKTVFFYNGLMNYLTSLIEPDFSLAFALIYSFKSSPLGYILMLVYLGLLGAGIGVVVWSLFVNLRSRSRPSSLS